MIFWAIPLDQPAKSDKGHAKQQASRGLSHRGHLAISLHKKKE